LLTARSGLWTPEQTRHHLAIRAARLDHWPGRTWRPLADTAIAAPSLFGAPEQWRSWRRATTDFYYEGMLIWLEADVLIRQKTGGKRSLDDFCRAFYGGASGPPEVKPYTFDDVVGVLNDVAAHDWREFFTRRLNSIEARAPLGGIEGGGWRLAYRDTPADFFKDAEKSDKSIDLSYSIGLVVKHDGDIQDVMPGMAAAKAGMAPGMKLIAVGGRKFTEERMREALAAGKTSTEPLELLAEGDDHYKTYRLDYHAGPRYPHLQRDHDNPDLLSAILKPLGESKATD